MKILPIRPSERVPHVSMKILQRRAEQSVAASISALLLVCRLTHCDVTAFVGVIVVNDNTENESRSPLLHLFHWPRVILHLLSLMLARNLLMAVSPLFPSLSTRTILNETAIRFSLCLLVVYDLSRPSVWRWS